LLRHNPAPLRDSRDEAAGGGLVFGAVERTEPEEWALVDELYPALHQFAAVVAPWDVDADDLLHDALVAILSRQSLLDLDHPAAYLRRVMVNLAAGASRRGARRKRALGRLAASVEPGRVPEYASDLAELEGLPAQERAVLYLAEVEGFRYAEIARMLGCSEVAARKRASRARRRLRVELAAEGLG
jgi:RNA polymerase sigma-70 factor (ECF subfamily)